MKPMVLTRRLSTLLRRAGIKGAQPCHGWRHTAATLLLDSGANIKVVQNRLGHASPSITLSTYCHAIDKRDAEAAEHLRALIDTGIRLRRARVMALPRQQ